MSIFNWIRNPLAAIMLTYLAVPPRFHDLRIVGPAYEVVSPASANGTTLQCDTIVLARARESGTIWSIAVGNGGEIAWTERSDSREVLIRNQRGVVRTAGRAGGGPGEFRAISRLFWRRDTLWVSDLAQARLQAFDVAGKLLDEIRLPGPGNYVLRDNRRLIGALVQGTLSSLSVKIVRSAVGSSRLDTLMSFSSSAERDPWLLPSLRQQAFVRADPTGQRWCVLGLHPPEQLALHCVLDDGRVASNTTASLSPEKVTDEQWNQLVEKFAKSSETSRDEIEKRFHRPPYLPVIRDVLVSSTGEVWTLRWTSSTTANRWDRLRADGTVASTVSLPASMTVMLLTADWMYGATSDDDGLQSLVRCRVPR